MAKNEDPGFSKSRLFKESIEKLCCPPPLQKYSTPSLAKQNKNTSECFLLKWPFSPIIKYSFFLLVALSFVICFFVLLRQPEGSLTPNNFVYLRGSCPDFVGRKEYLDILYNDLILNRDVSITCIRGIWGKGGFGKTELALEFANRFRLHFSMIWTFYCDSEVSLKQGYQELAKQLGIYHPSDTPAKTKEKVHFHLENENLKKPWLLIFDNVENELTDYPERGGSIIFTSQKKISNPLHLLEIKPFSKEESLQLLENITGEKRSSSMEELAQGLERVPLLMNYAAHYIKATPGCNTADYQNLFCRQLFEKAGPLWKELDVNRRYFKSLASSWQFPLKKLEKENPTALAWLFVCSYLYPENIPETWIDDWLAIQAKSPGKPLDIQRKEILQSLQKYGIIYFQEKSRTFSLHRFFQYMIRESRQAHIQEDLSSIFSLLSRYNHHYNFFQSLSWESGNYWYLHAYELTKWVSAYPKYFSDQISLANFFSALGRWNLFNYHFSAALDYFYQAVDLRQTAEKKISSTSATDYTFIGYCYFQTGYFRQALKVLNLAEEVHRAHAQIKPLAFSTFLDIKGACLLELREYEEALKCFHEGVKSNQNYQGDKYKNRISNFDSMTFCLLSNIARTLRDLGRYPESMEYFNQAEPLGVKSCGKDHPYYIVYMVEKAPLLLKMGRPREALQMMEQVVDEYFALNKKNSAKSGEFGELGLTWYTMGMVYFDLNQISKAKAMFKQGRECSQKYVGKHSHFMKRAHHGLGLVYLKEKKTKRALHHFLRELRLHAEYEIEPKLLVPIFEEFQKKLGDILRVKGSTSYIHKTSKEAAILTEKALGKDHPLTVYFLQDGSAIDNSKVKI